MRTRAALAGFLLLTGCSAAGLSPTPSQRAPAAPERLTREQSESGTGLAHAISEFQIITMWPRAQPFDIAAARDGTLWFTEPGLSAIGHIGGDGTIRQFFIPTRGGEPEGIVAGGDGSMYFAEHMGPNYATHVATIASDGHVTEYNDSNLMPIGVAAGPNGSMWFTQGCAGLAVLSHGKVTQYPISGITGESPAIVRAPDGSMWFSEDGTARIGRVGPEGQLRTYTGLMYESKYNDIPNGVTAGPDGNLWWTALASNAIWATNLHGRVVHVYTVPTAGSQPWGIATGRDGALWFTEAAGDKIGRVTTAGAFSEYPLPTPYAHPQGIARNRDGSLWFVESGADQLGRIAD
ncbi:MAG: hypothetical protein JO160_02355 [Candidatus Eremiobacteraeota bacterium]|nr:hypothetical protein [Candidatus Eremiobacteraeota bacterium]